MCGIAGILRHASGRPVARGELATMSRLLRHRGPDDDGLFLDGACGLAHRRLTILDRSRRGRQPMTSEDGSLALVYNGEVYNFLELREELEREGYRFRTRTDTEVLLHLYRARGPGFVSQLNGMFAFALWDRRERRLLLARDRLGIKPLYLAATPEGLAFASELKPLLAILPERPRLDPERLDAYLSVGYVPGERTLLAGIRKLLPGWTLQVDDGGVREAPYWRLDPDAHPQLGDAGAWVEATRDLLQDAVRLQLRSDVPLGVFLSGGVDSSAVVAMMHRLGVEQIRTFTVAYDFGPGFDETRWARSVARRFGTRHEEVFVTPEQFRASVPVMVRHMEEPVTEAAAISLLHVSQLAREHVKVVLSGEGADEVFAGYPIYTYMLALERYRQVPAPLRERLLDPLLARLGPKWRKYVELSRRPLERRYLGVSLYDPAVKRALLRREATAAWERDGFERQVAALYAATAGHPPLTRMTCLDVATWLVDDLLVKADKMTMACGLELRVPFLDHRLVELGAAIPPQLRLRRGRTKNVLKEALRGVLPRAILDRRKMGFPTPLAALFRGPLRGYVRETLGTRDLPLPDVFEPAAVQRLVREHLVGARDHHRVLWQLLVLAEWQREIVEGAPRGWAAAETA